MRLTLRTLLAYLDDTLQPAQAREIGEKISQSKDATALVARIKDVIRRRRIGAPEIAGPGSGPDPNLIADYLESVLPPNQVVELEKLCQSSDMHLAEIAACHKILTMVMGHPVDVADEVRDRMVALGAAAPRTPPDQAEQALKRMPDGMSDTAAAAEPHVLPDYLRRRNGTGQKLAMAGIVLLGIGWLALVLTDRSLWTPLDAVALAPVSVPVEPAPPVDEGPAAPAAPVEEAVPPAAAPGENVAVIPPTQPNFAPPAPEVELPTGEMPPAVPPTVPPVSPPAANVVPPAAVPAVLAEVDVLSFAGDGMVISRLPFAPDWQMADLATPIRLDAEFASPEPFRQEYAIGSLGGLELLPGARLRRLHRGAQGEAAFALNRGRIVLTSSSAATQPLSLQLDIAGQSWIVALDEPGTRVGIEVIRPTVPNVASSPAETQLSRLLGVVSGQARIGPAGQAGVVVPAGALHQFSLIDGAAQTAAVGNTLPAWMQPGGENMTSAARQLAKLYEAEFLRDRTVPQSISPVVTDRRAAIAELAVRTIGLIDRYQDLVVALTAEHHEPRIAAVHLLRLWIAEDAANLDTLTNELGARFPPDQASLVRLLLLGVSPEQAAVPPAGEELIRLLGHESITIRELAILNLQRLTGKTLDYLAMAPPQERRAGIVRWEELLKKNNGVLVPAAN